MEISPVVFGLILLLLGGAGAAVGFLLFRRPSSPETQIYSSLERLKSIGHLSAFKAYTKEIVTESDHAWGETGAKYFSWILSKKKLAIIFEFEVDFRYDLRNPEFKIASTAQGRYIVKMPPCLHEVHIRNIRFYDEQRAKVLPWLLPDLINGFYPDGFTPDDKNRLVDAARSQAERNAMTLIKQLEPEVQRSAEATLRSISKAFGAEMLEFVFDQQADIWLKVGIPEKIVDESGGGGVSVQ